MDRTINPAVLRDYEKSFDKASDIWARSQIGFTHTKLVVTVAKTNSFRRCNNCKVTHKVTKGERIRELCPHCESPKMEWVDCHGKTKAEGPDIQVAAGISSTTPYYGQYDNLDFSIDFDRWLAQQRHDAHEILYRRLVLNQSLRDIAVDIHATYQWVQKVINRTRDNYHGKVRRGYKKSAQVYRGVDKKSRLTDFQESNEICDFAFSASA